MKIFLFLLLVLTFNGALAEECSETVEHFKGEAEAFVLELNMDRVEMLYFIRDKVNLDGGQESKEALDFELYKSIMEVLIKSKSTTSMIMRVADIRKSFDVYPLQIPDEMSEELNNQLNSRLATGI